MDGLAFLLYLHFLAFWKKTYLQVLWNTNENGMPMN